MDNSADLFLDTPIRELTPPVRDDFYLRCKLLGFKTLREIVKTDKAKLHANPNFTYGWLNELLDILGTRDLVWMMDIDGDDDDDNEEDDAAFWESVKDL